MLAAFGRCYEWARLRLEPSEIVTPMPKQWMSGEDKSARSRRLAETLGGYAPALDRGHDQADAIGLAQWFALRAHLLR